MHTITGNRIGIFREDGGIVDETFLRDERDTLFYTFLRMANDSVTEWQDRIIPVAGIDSSKTYTERLELSVLSWDVGFAPRKTFGLVFHQDNGVDDSTADINSPIIKFSDSSAAARFAKRLGIRDNF